jgi:DNA-binding transcriptional ArsR family regulator
MRHDQEVHDNMAKTARGRAPDPAAALQRAIDGKRAERDKLVAKLDAEIARYEEARPARTGSPKPAPAAAGQTNAEAALAFMHKHNGRATQAEIASALGKPKNSIRHALAVLAKQGSVRATDEVVNRSPVYVIVPAEQAAAAA